MSARHVYGPAPRVFSLDVELPPEPADDEGKKLHAALVKKRDWALGRAARFAERASAANAHRLRVRRISAQLQQVYAERQARKAKSREDQPHGLSDQQPEAPITSRCNWDCTTLRGASLKEQPQEQDQ